MSHTLDTINLTPREQDGLRIFQAPFRAALDALLELPLTDARVWAEGEFRSAYLMATRAYCEGVEKNRAPT